MEEKEIKEEFKDKAKDAQKLLAMGYEPEEVFHLIGEGIDLKLAVSLCENRKNSEVGNDIGQFTEAELYALLKNATEAGIHTLVEDDTKERNEKIGMLKAAGYTGEKIREMIEDGYEFSQTAEYIRRGCTKEDIEKDFSVIERKEMKAAGCSDALIDVWQKEGIINHSL